ncbi:MAG: aminotransferase DegT, partial [Bacteroidia bacterium]|nr:aminotransferase DegT [Bacteroidia bacterium]
YTIMLESKEQRDALQKRLKVAGIPSMVYYPRGLHQQTAYKWMNLDNTDYQNTVYATGHVLSLPMHPYLDEATVDEICKAVLSNI